MKKLSLLAAATVAALAIAGCSSVETAKHFNGQKLSSDTAVAHISATSYGLYLLTIPLITGSETNVGMPTLLTDTVSPACISRMVTEKATKEGSKRVVDFTTQESSIGLLFSMRSITASGTAVK